MSKSNVSDIDYSVFNTTTSSETPSEAPKLKSGGISKRSIVKAKAEEKPRDLTNASNPAQIAQRATDTANALPNVEVPDTLANYALPVLGAIGTGLAAYGLWKNQNKLPLGETVAGAPPEGMTQKTDLRNVQPVAETPAAPQPEFPKATTQQSALPQGYGQQTINAPTGAPVVPTAAPQPVAPAQPAPVDPILEANIRRANALAAKAESEAAAAAHKLQKLQTPAATGPATATKAAKETLKPSDASLVTSGGLNATANKMHQDFPLTSVDSLVKNTPAPEVQGAVDVVKQQEQKQIEGKSGKAVEVPEGRIPSYMTGKTKKNGTVEYKNKQGSDVIGQGGWHWYQGQMGPAAEEAWLQQFGRTNQSYADVKQAAKEGRLPLPAPVEGKKGGTFTREATVPNYIKGSVAPGALAATAALATVPALAAAGYHSYKGNKEAVDAELKDAWHSLKSAFTWPVDVAKAAGKGDFGPLKDALMSMNPGTLLLNEANKQDQQAIQRMIQAEKVNAGRGIAPPSSYQR